MITGSSRGIGKAIALALAKDGYDVIVHCASNAHKAQEVCDEISALGGNVRYIQADLSDPAQVVSPQKTAACADVLILNASYQIKKPFGEIWCCPWQYSLLLTGSP